LGYFTSRIPIMDYSGEREEMNVYVMDSSTMKDCNVDLAGSSCISPDVIDWYIDQNVKYSHKLKTRDFVFMQDPIQEYMAMANNYNVTGHRQDSISC